MMKVHKFIVTLLFVALACGRSPANLKTQESRLKNSRIMGDEVPNGGDVLVNAANELEATSIMLLDYREARTLLSERMGQTPCYATFNDQNEPVENRIKNRVNDTLIAMSRFDPVRADAYQRSLDVFFGEMKHPEGLDLEDVPDSNHIGRPTGFMVRQGAIQISLPMAGTPRYLFDGDIWKRMSEIAIDDLAGLVLHEIIYREAITVYNQKDSRKVRFFNGFLGSCSLRTGNLGTYLEALKEANFEGEIPLQGLKFDASSVITYPSGNFKSGKLLDRPENVTFTLPTGVVELRPSNRHLVQFSETGFLQKARTFPGTRLRLNASCEHKKNILPFHQSPDDLEFDENGKVRSISPAQNLCLPNGNATRIFPLRKISLSENGIPMGAELMENGDRNQTNFPVTLNSGVAVNAH